MPAPTDATPATAVSRPIRATEPVACSTSSGTASKAKESPAAETDCATQYVTKERSRPSEGRTGPGPGRETHQPRLPPGRFPWRPPGRWGTLDGSRAPPRDGPPGRDLGGLTCGSPCSSPAWPTPCSPRRPRPRYGCWSASATRSSSPQEQTCCGQMHVNTGYQDEALPLVRRPRRDLRPRTTWWSPRPARASARCGTSTRWWPGGPATSALAGRAEAVGARTYELSELLVDVLGVDRRRGATTRTGSPTTRPATRCGMLRVGDRPLRLLRAVRGIDLVELPAGRAVLRLRRHLRDEERGHLHGDAGRQDAPRAGHRRRRAAPPGTPRA